MDENAAIEAAMLSILYFDLVEGLRRRGQYDYNSGQAGGTEGRLARTKSHGERVDTYDTVVNCDKNKTERGRPTISSEPQIRGLFDSFLERPSEPLCFEDLEKVWGRPFFLRFVPYRPC